MRKYNPPHPGEILSGLWLNPMGLSVTKAALALGVSRKTLSKIVNGNSGISPKMPFRLPLPWGEALKVGWVIRLPTISGK